MYNFVKATMFGTSELLVYYFLLTMDNSWQRTSTCPTSWRPHARRYGARGFSKRQQEMERVCSRRMILLSDSHQLSYIWANDEAVRESLAVRKETKGEWKRCDFDIPYTKDITSTVEHHLSLRKEGYPALIYSGDHDSKFSFVGTQAWIRSFNLSITDDWRPWYVDGQVAGFTRSFSSNLTYATVKGAGHTAPEYKSKDCLAMFARWISGEPLWKISINWVSTRQYGSYHWVFVASNKHRKPTRFPARVYIAGLQFAFATLFCFL